MKIIPTPRMVILCFNKLNILFFKGRLKRYDELEIRRRHGIWAECILQTSDNKIILSINDWFTDRSLFINVIAHEMVHIHQIQNGKNMSHGKTFDKWKPIFFKKNIILDTKN